MKILYGVQATGNGHISRARAMNKHLEALGVEVDYVFSGRDPQDYFDMQEFRNLRYQRGLSLAHTEGRVDIQRTLQAASLPELIHDIRAMDTRKYDLVLSDFEPIVAWAARRQKTFCLGIGHQYAFQEAIPKQGENFFLRSLMRHFAPCQTHLGMHWHHFNCNILPPIAETQADISLRDKNQYLVYLAFEEKAAIAEFLEGFEEQTFICYGPYKSFEKVNNILFKPASRDGFARDLAQSSGVICNAGFELPSEALQLGVKLLVKPLIGQFEQESNARALEELGLGLSMTHLDKFKLGFWLHHFEARHIRYPNVAQAIAQWLVDGDWHNTADFAKELWQQVEYVRAPRVQSECRFPNQTTRPHRLEATLSGC